MVKYAKSWCCWAYPHLKPKECLRFFQRVCSYIYCSVYCTFTASSPCCCCDPLMRVTCSSPAEMSALTFENAPRRDVGSDFGERIQSHCVIWICWSVRHRRGSETPQTWLLCSWSARFVRASAFNFDSSLAWQKEATAHIYTLVFLQRCLCKCVSLVLLVCLSTGDKDSFPR